MLVLFETPAGYGLFKVLKEGKVEKNENLWSEFEDEESAQKMVKLMAFSPFESTADAVAAASDIIEGKVGKDLKSFLKKQITKGGLKDKLAVADKALGGMIKEKLDIQCVNNDSVMELYRGIRNQMDCLLAGLISEAQLKQMQLGLSHSLSRYKLKFSADKVDTMIVQAIGLLDELDKEINTYAMRVKEWYGWHFPEMAKIINDNVHYSKIIIKMGVRNECKNTDFSDILGDEAIETSLKETAEISMGTEIAENDVVNIKALATEVVALSEYRIQLFAYLQNRMQAIAPNLTIMVGDLVGARLISKAGSLLNLAKHPASTIQILGAEKALFRALKTKHDTPKYGLIYHASLIGQCAPKNRGKISRVLAAKTALAIRYDALGDGEDSSIGLEHRAKVETRLRQLEGGMKMTLTSPKSPSTIKKYEKADAAPTYNDASDMVVDESPKDKKKKKKKDKKEEAKEEIVEEEEEIEEVKKSAKKSKKRKAEEVVEEVVEEEPEKKKKKKDKKSKK